MTEEVLRGETPHDPPEVDQGKKVIGVDEDYNISYEDGTVETCKFQPHQTFVDCEPGYGPGGHCAKYDHYCYKSGV